jgi:hypothetical protein
MMYSGDEDCGDEITSGPGVEDNCTCCCDCRAGAKLGTWHQHADDPCPVHPDAPMVG